LAVKDWPVAATVTFFRAPPCFSASRSGLISTTTSSPAFTALRDHPPARTRLPGLVISSSHSEGSSPSATVPFTRSVTCGLVQRSSITTPLRVSVLE
jgi:hypothetical protein